MADGDRWSLRASGSADTDLHSQCRVLASVSPDWPRITDSYRPATAFEQMKAVLSDKLDLPRADQSAWQTRIDGILHNLQTIHEPGEADLRQQEVHYQRIIKHGGIPTRPTGPRRPRRHSRSHWSIC